MNKFPAKLCVYKHLDSVENAQPQVEGVLDDFVHVAVVKRIQRQRRDRREDGTQRRGERVGGDYNFPPMSTAGATSMSR